MVKGFQPVEQERDFPGGTQRDSPTPVARDLFSAVPPFQIELRGRAVHCQGVAAQPFPGKHLKHVRRQLHGQAFGLLLYLVFRAGRSACVWSQTLRFGMFSEFSVRPRRPPAPVLCMQSPDVAVPHHFGAPTIPAPFGSSLG